MAWTNQHVRLFHGTHIEAVRGIRDSGQLDLDLARNEADFGSGFYTTTNLAQAQHWSNRSVINHVLHTGRKSEAIVLVANVDRTVLGEMSTLFFTRPNSDFWKFIHHCRKGKNHVTTNGWYDVVAGPLSRFPQNGTFLGGDQISFHTLKACELLFNSLEL